MVRSIDIIRAALSQHEYRNAPLATVAITPHAYTYPERAFTYGCILAESGTPIGPHTIIGLVNSEADALMSGYCEARQAKYERKLKNQRRFYARILPALADKVSAS